MKITLSCLTLLVVFTSAGVGAAQIADGQAARSANRPANDQVDVACLPDTINNGCACIQMPGDEVDDVLHEMSAKEAPTAKVIYNDATRLYEITYRYDDSRPLDYYGKSACPQTEEGQRRMNAYLARRDAADKAEAEHMKKALADLEPYIIGKNSKKSLQPYLCGGPHPSEVWDANDKDMGYQAIYVSVADPENVSLVQSLLPSSIDGYRVQATYVTFAPDTVLPFSDGPCSGGTPCGDNCQFPCNDRCFRWCPSSCKSED
jgi:hypothetical protein